MQGKPAAVADRVDQVLLAKACGIDLRRMRWCWRCYSMSYLRPASCCTLPSCPSFGFGAALGQLRTEPQYDEGKTVVSAFYNQTGQGLDAFFDPAQVDVPFYQFGIVEAKTDAKPKAKAKAKAAPKAKGKAKGKAKAKPKAMVKKPTKAKGKATPKAAAKAKAEAKAKAQAKAQAAPKASP